MIESKTIKDRLKEFIAFKGLNNKEFEEQAKLSNSFVHSGEGQFIRDSSLKKISKAFPELNIEWLRHGIGEMLNGNATVNSNNIENNSNSSFFATNLGNNNNVGVQPAVIEDTLRSLSKIIEKQSMQIDEIINIIKTISKLK